MNFKEYIDKLQNNIIAENMSGQALLDNFKEVFPYSEKDNGVIGNINIEKSSNIEATEENPEPYDNILTATGYVQSGSEEHGKHKVTVKFTRKSPEKQFSIKDDCEIHCDCNAFRYNVAYPDLQNKAFYGQPQNYNKIINKVRNPNKVPAACKHCYSLLIALYNKGILRNN